MLGYVAFASVAVLVLLMVIAAVFLCAVAASGSKPPERKRSEAGEDAAHLPDHHGVAY